MKKLEFINVSKAYTGGYGAIASASFTLDYGERLTIIGDAMSGKTTLAKLAAGLEDKSSGEIIFNGETELSPDKVNIGYFTDTMRKRISVYSVVEYPLMLRAVTDTNPYVKNALELFNISNLARLKIKDLSRVQRRLVALARLFAVERDLYILDNPLGDLPHSERAVLLNDLKRAIKGVKGSVVFFTDSVAEAEMLGFMNNALLTYGVLSDIAPLSELMKSPTSIAEAALLSDGRVSLIPLKSDGVAASAEFMALLETQSVIGEFSSVTAALYYDDFIVGRGGFSGVVTGIESNTAGFILTVECGGTELKVFSDKAHDVGSKIDFSIKEGALKLFDAASEQSILKR